MEAIMLRTFRVPEVVTYVITAIELSVFGIEYLRFPLSFQQTAQTAYLIHTAIIFILVLVLCGTKVPFSQNRPEHQNAIRASWQFFAFWSLLWVSILTFYCVWTWSEIYGTRADHATHVLLDVLSLLPMAFVFLCYFVLATPTTPPHPFEFFRVALFILTIGGILILAEAGLTSSNSALEGFFDGAQGLISGVVMALFVGRLDSKLMDSKRWIIAALYGYAVLQLAYPLIEGTEPDPSERLAILFLALIFKLLLFWHVRSLIISGRLTYYMLEYRKITATSSDSWEEFKKEFFPAQQAVQA
jgi:hypothetical protein